MPKQSVTSAKLSSALSDLIDGNGSLEQALPAGSVIARKPWRIPATGYTLFQRNEYNASLVWEEKAPVSVARNAMMELNINGIRFILPVAIMVEQPDFESYDPRLNTWSNLLECSKKWP